MLAAGSEGNFEVRSDAMFKGYLDRPDLFAEAMTADGFYRTGDLATIDEEGYVRITGRVKDLINRGGEKVPVAEIEQLLYAHPSVSEVAIVAMPDERLGERACAFVVLRQGAELDFQAMLAYLDAPRVAKTYWPERLELVQALPRTPSGKIQKYLLREYAAELQRACHRARRGDSTSSSTELKQEVADYVRAEGERWAALIEARARGADGDVGRAARPRLPAACRAARLRRPRDSPSAAIWSCSSCSRCLTPRCA